LAGGVLNTDDRSILEFAFARTSHEVRAGSVVDVRDVARARGEHQPRLLEKHLDWERITDEWIAFRASEQNEIRTNDDMTMDQRTRASALIRFLNGRQGEAAAQWRAQPREPQGPTELAAIGAALAETGNQAAMLHINRLREIDPVEADAVLARFHLRTSSYDEARDALVAAFVGYRNDPWPWPMLMTQAFETAKELGRRHPPSIEALRRALEQPFACAMLDDIREETRLRLLQNLPMDDSCALALASFEPYVPWAMDFLTWRAQCYERVHHREAPRAVAELQEFMAAQPTAIGDGLVDGAR
jgi:hypothetical protein